MHIFTLVHPKSHSLHTLCVKNAHSPPSHADKPTIPLFCFLATKSIVQVTACMLIRGWSSEQNNPISCKKGKAVLLKAWSGPEGSRKLRFPDFMTTAQDGGKVVSLTHRPPLTPGNTPGTHFCWRLSRPQGHSATGRIMSLKNSNDTVGNRTRDLPVCSVVP